MTLVQFWTNERDLYQGQKNALGAGLPPLQKQLDEVKNGDPNASPPKKGLKQATAALAAIEASIADKRAALAKATVPSEAQALVTAIRDLQIDLRLKTGEILDFQEQADALQLEVDLQSQRLQRVTARLADAAAKLKTAEDAGKRRDTLKERATTAPLKDVPSQANAAKTGPDHTNAKAQIDTLPAELLGLATKRVEYRNKRLTNASTAVKSAEDEQASRREAWGAEGKSEQERVAFARAEAALQAFVSAAQSEFDRAVAQLKAIAATPLLSTSETSSIAADNDRRDAADDAAAVTAARVAVEDAEVDLDTTEFSKRAADPDADLSADVTLNGKKAALATAVDKLKEDSTTNYPDARKAISNQWQAIVTDRSWKSIVDFFDADAAINRLAGLSATVLVTDLNTKEAAFAAALADLAKARRQQEYVDDIVAKRRDRLAALEKARPLRMVSAVRGDSY